MLRSVECLLNGHGWWGGRGQETLDIKEHYQADKTKKQKSYREREEIRNNKREKEEKIVGKKVLHGKTK
jgi:hypothetical protein